MISAKSDRRRRAPECSPGRGCSPGADGRDSADRSRAPGSGHPVGMSHNSAHDDRPMTTAIPTTAAAVSATAGTTVHRSFTRFKSLRFMIGVLHDSSSARHHQIPRDTGRGAVWEVGVPRAPIRKGRGLFGAAKRCGSDDGTGRISMLPGSDEWPVGCGRCRVGYARDVASSIVTREAESL